MRIAPFLLAAAVALGIGCPNVASAADDDGALGGVLRRLREGLSGSSPAEPPAPAPAAHAIVGTPEPPGYAITGRVWTLPPSEQFLGREAALRFRFQQQIRTGAWPPPIQPE